MKFMKSHHMSLFAMVIFLSASKREPRPAGVQATKLRPAACHFWRWSSRASPSRPLAELGTSGEGRQAAAGTVGRISVGKALGFWQVFFWAPWGDLTWFWRAGESGYRLAKWLYHVRSADSSGESGEYLNFTVWCSLKKTSFGKSPWSLTWFKQKIAGTPMGHPRVGLRNMGVSLQSLQISDHPNIQSFRHVFFFGIGVYSVVFLMNGDFQSRACLFPPAGWLWRKCIQSLLLFWGWIQTTHIKIIMTS